MYKLMFARLLVLGTTFGGLSWTSVYNSPLAHCKFTELTKQTTECECSQAGWWSVRHWWDRM